MNNIISLSDYLNMHPWKEEYLRLNKPINYFFHIECNNDLQQIWKVLSDTSKINDLMGFKKMTFTEDNGKKIGENNALWIGQKWYEVPWQWIYGDFISSERIYSKGLLHYARAMFLIKPIDNNNYRVYIYFGWIVRGLLGKIIFKVYKKKFQKKFINVIKKLLKDNGKTRTSNRNINQVNNKVDPKLAELNRKKIFEYKSKILNENINKEIFDTFINFIFYSSDNELDRLRPKEIASILNLDENEIIKIMLYSTKAGLLNMKWEVLCPNCQGVKDHLFHLWEIPKGGKCDKCDIDFVKNGYNLLEIAFYLNPEIKKIEEKMFCSAEPAKKPKILLQIKLESKEDRIIKLPFPKGRYRLVRIDKLNYSYLDITDESDFKELFWSSNDENKNIIASVNANLRIFNESDKTLYFVIQENDIDQNVLRPSDLFNFQEFRDLFPEESLAEGLSIDIGVQNLLFIDIVGSSELYNRVGNIKAFSIVRNFYKQVYEIVKIYDGSIIKTIGDAVMISFKTPLNTLRSSIKLIQTFQKLNEEFPFTTRITINRGSCLAVNMNSGIDYFGNPVNITAKLQAYANSNEILMTDDFVEDKSVKEYLLSKNYNFNVSHEASIKGIGNLTYWRIIIVNKNKE